MTIDGPTPDSGPVASLPGAAPTTTPCYLATGRARDVGRGATWCRSERLRELVERWFPFGRHIHRWPSTRRCAGSTSTARQHESLVALGKLAAGLAHEINNPASASLRAVESLRNTSDYMLQSLVGLARQGVDHADAVRSNSTGSERELQERPSAVGGALALADREEVLGEWMDDRAIAFAWQIAPRSLAARVSTRTGANASQGVVGADGLEPALQWISSTIGVTGLLERADRRDRSDLPLVQDVKIVLADGSSLAAARRRRERHREHTHDAGAASCERHRSGARLRRGRPRDRGLRRLNSTRCGPT